MKSIYFKSLKSCIYISVALGILLPSATMAERERGSSKRSDRLMSIAGIPVTGINELCGDPVFSLPLPAALPPTFKATNLGEYNPGGALPFTLTDANCRNEIIVATTTDQEFLTAVGIPDSNIGLKNLPLRQNFVITGQDGSRSQLLALNQVQGNALPPTKSNPNNPITLGQWLDARGNITIRCPAFGRASIEARFRNLIPNGVYTMWGVWTTQPPGPPIVPVPLGGVPNALVPDRAGNASFFRELAACPKDVTPDGSLMMFITLAYHSDNDLNGANPELGAIPTTIQPANGPAFISTFVPGVATHDAMEFPINAQVIR